MEKLKVIIADDGESIELVRNILIDSYKVDVIQEVNEPLKIESSINL